MKFSFNYVFIIGRSAADKSRLFWLSMYGCFFPMMIPNVKKIDKASDKKTSPAPISPGDGWLNCGRWVAKLREKGG